ncbi:MAG: histidinol-phosphate aminotransferase [Cryomorphaceae bacterium]|jgi:histidinol-phosphate aminotransferase
MSRFWSDNVANLTPYTPGEQPQIDNLIKLNTNENPYGPSPKVLQAIANVNNDALRKYPDPVSSDLKQSIAHYYNLALDQVFVGNSSDEVLGHTFRALLKQSKPLLFPDISYSFYPVYCQLFDIDYLQVPLRDDFTLNLDDYSPQNGGIIFANPNAPTGIALQRDKIERLLQSNTESVVVVDEAYVDFSDVSSVNLIKQYPNLLVVQTLSKSRCLAGLRVGLALGNKDLIEGLERVKNSFHPYTLDTLAVAGARAAFEDEDYFNSTNNKIIATRSNTRDSLQDLGFSVLPSSANFLFVTHKTRAAAELFSLLRERKIIVRHFDAMRINNYLRISIGTDQQMQQLLDALREILSS